jgi:hypothetical protein
MHLWNDFTVMNTLEHGFKELQSGGGSAILDELANSDEKPSGQDGILFDDEEVDNILEEITEEGADAEAIIEEVVEEFNLLDYEISEEALRGDRISSYNWQGFWDSVRSVFGGVEFMPDIFEINKWRDVNIIWAGLLDIHSGVIFNPASFRGGVRPVLQVGGRRKTRRDRRKHRKTMRRGKKYT